MTHYTYKRSLQRNIRQEVQRTVPVEEQNQNKFCFILGESCSGEERIVYLLLTQCSDSRENLRMSVEVISLEMFT